MVLKMKTVPLHSPVHLTKVDKCDMNKSLKYLHDAVPVVAGGNLEECEEGHPKVFKGGMAAHSFTGVISVTH